MKQTLKSLGGGAWMIGALAVWQSAAAQDQAPVAQGAALATATATAPATEGAQPYRVVNGDQVDADTLKGWKVWRSMACERCHGAAQEGMVGPSLVQSLKVLSKEDFRNTVLNGRVEKGMPNFGGTQTMVDNIDRLYAYLKGRSDGAIKPGHLRGIE